MVGDGLEHSLACFSARHLLVHREGLHRPGGELVGELEGGRKDPLGVMISGAALRRGGNRRVNGPPAQDLDEPVYGADLSHEEFPVTAIPQQEAEPTSASGAWSDTASSAPVRRTTPPLHRPPRPSPAQYGTQQGPRFPVGRPLLRHGRCNSSDRQEAIPGHRYCALVTIDTHKA